MAQIRAIEQGFGFAPTRISPPPPPPPHVAPPHYDEVAITIGGNRRLSPTSVGTSARAYISVQELEWTREFPECSSQEFMQQAQTALDSLCREIIGSVLQTMNGYYKHSFGLYRAQLAVPTSVWTRVQRIFRAKKYRLRVREPHVTDSYYHYNWEIEAFHDQ